MRAVCLLMLCGWIVGCGEEVVADPDTAETGDPPPEEPDGACGDVTEHDLTLTGRVTLDGAPVEGANVTLEERAWHVGGEVFGTALTDAGGRFALDVEDVVSVENCWGSALAYYVVGIRGDARGELEVNGALYQAIRDGEHETEVLFPVEITR